MAGTVGCPPLAASSFEDCPNCRTRQVPAANLRQHKERRRKRIEWPRRQRRFTRRSKCSRDAKPSSEQPWRLPRRPRYPRLPAMAQVADDVSALPREKVALVAPPFVHAHEQVATGGPKVVEFTMTIEEKPIVIDDEGTTLRGNDLQRLDPRSDDGRPRRRLCRAHAGQPRDQRDAAQHRLPRRHRRARRRRR